MIYFILGLIRKLDFHNLKALKHIKKSSLGKLALAIVIITILIAIFADVIANEKPLFTKIDGTTSYPIFQKNKFSNTDWSIQEFEKVIFAPIPFSPNTITKNERALLRPGTKVNNKRHILGTDSIGRDVAAGIIHGTRWALLVGLLSMAMALFFGITFGVLSGYFGDHRYESNILQVLVFTIWIFLVCFYLVHQSIMLVCIMSIFCLILFIIIKAITKNKNLAWTRLFQIKIPFDMIIMRAIEIWRSVPALFILLTIMAWVQKPSIYIAIIIIGLLRWPGIARMLRGEILKIRDIEYIQSAKVLGLSHWKIIKNHVLPNSLGPVIILSAFGISSSILLEATISFLGIGASAEVVTWGSLLSEARAHFSAWWLALFPGICIFLLVLSFNVIGERMSERK